MKRDGRIIAGVEFTVVRQLGFGALQLGHPYTSPKGGFARAMKPTRAGPRHSGADLPKANCTAMLGFCKNAARHLGDGLEHNGMSG